MVWWMHAVLIPLYVLNLYFLHDVRGRKGSPWLRWFATGCWGVALAISLYEMLKDLARVYGR